MALIKRTIWRRLFQGKSLASEIAEKAIEEQIASERKMGRAPYAMDQRFIALKQRAARIAGGEPTIDTIAILADAAKDWERASAAALDVK
jgi:hypothetical protein